VEAASEEVKERHYAEIMAKVPYYELDK